MTLLLILLSLPLLHHLSVPIADILKIVKKSGGDLVPEIGGDLL